MPDSETAVVDTSLAPTGEARTTRRRLYPGHQFLVVLVTAVVVGTVVSALELEPLDLGMVNLWMVYSIIAIGFYFIFAVAGQFALSQAFMAMVGGYVSAVASPSTGVPLGIVCGITTAGVLAAAFALLMRRVTEFYFAIATLGLAEIGTIVIRNWDYVGGVDGTRIGIQPLEALGRQLRMQDEVFWGLLAAFTLALLVAAAFERSPLRRELIAVHRTPEVAATLGVPVTLLRVTVFAAGSMLAAFGGALYAHWQGFVSTEAFGLDLSIGIFIMVLFGGTSSMWGAVIGAAFYVVVPVKFEFLGGYLDVFFGGLILVLIIAFPEGLIGIARSVARRLPRRIPGTQRRAGVS